VKTMNFLTFFTVFIFILRCTCTSTDISMVTISVTIGGLNIKQAFITNSIQKLFNVKESVNVIKIISLSLKLLYFNQYLKLLFNNSLFVITIVMHTYL